MRATFDSNRSSLIELRPSYSMRAESDFPGIVAGLGYTDMDHYKRVSDGFTAAMEQDSAMKLSTHFGQLFAKYGTGHVDASQQHSVDLVVEALEEVDDQEQREEQAIVEVMQRAGCKKRQVGAFTFLRSAQ